MTAMELEKEKRVSRFYLDDKHRKGEPFLVHQEACLFRRDKAMLLGEYSWASKAIEAALGVRPAVARCQLCCSIPAICPKKPRQTKLQRLAKKLDASYKARSR